MMSTLVVKDAQDAKSISVGDLAMVEQPPPEAFAAKQRRIEPDHQAATGAQRTRRRQVRGPPNPAAGVDNHSSTPNVFRAASLASNARYIDAASTVANAS